MRCVASLALALLLHAASTSAQSAYGYGCEINNLSKQFALVEKYYGSSLTACASKLSSNTQFLLSVPACDYQLQSFDPSSPSSTCPANCKNAFNEGGPVCVMQYLTLLGNKDEEYYNYLTHGKQLDPTTAEFMAASSRIYNNTPSNSPLNLYWEGECLYSLVSVCGAAVASSGSEGMEGPLVTVLLALVFTWVLLLK